MKGLSILLVIQMSATCVLSEGVSGIQDDGLVDILDRINKLEGKVEHLEGKTTILNAKNTLLGNKVSDLNESIGAQHATMETMTTELHLATSGKMDRRLILYPSLPITFTARIRPRVIDHVNPGDVIPFNDVLTNQGGGYSANASIFSVPMGGMYILSCSMLDHVGSGSGSRVKLHADIVRNGNVLVRVFAHAGGSSARDQGAQTIFVELQAGDKVWIRNYNTNNLGVGGELYSTFSGYLLWPLE